jgi:hypothetical protein
MRTGVRRGSPDPAGVPDRRSPYLANRPDRRSGSLIAGPGLKSRCALRAHSDGRRPVLGHVKGSFFSFLRGCRRSLSTARSVAIWIVPNGPGHPPSNHSSPAGNAFISGSIWDRVNRVTQACHLKRVASKTRPPNWPYRRFYRSPLPVPLDTSVGAPERARRSLAKGGRTDRWPRTTAIQSRYLPPYIST